jgi:hypothetical protein
MVNGRDEKQPGYRALSYRGTVLRAAAGVTAGHEAMVVLGAAAFGVAELIVFPELWGGGGHMGFIFINSHEVSNKLCLLYEYRPRGHVHLTH